MSGQLISTENQQSLSLDTDNSAAEPLDLPIEDTLISDPIAAFLEKHAHEFTLDHKGQRLTYGEAVPGCPGLAMLIRTIGEAAYYATAAPHEEEKVEEETKTEVADETEIKEDQKNQETDIKSDDLKREEAIASKKPAKDAEPHTDQIINKTETVQVAFQTPILEPSNGRSRSNKPSNGSSTLISSNRESTKLSRKAPGHDIVGLPISPLKIRESASQKDVSRPELVQPAQTEHAGSSSLRETLPEIAPEQPKLEKLAKVDLVREEAEEPIESKEQQSTNGHQEVLYSDFNEDEDEGPVSHNINLVSIPKETLRNSEQQLDYVSIEEGSVEEFMSAIPRIDSFEPTEYIAAEPEVAYKLPVAVEEVETVVLELSGWIEKLEVKETEVIHQILDKVAIRVEEVRILMEPQLDSQENSTQNLETAQEELSELFIELFEFAGIEYTPELVKAFVRLALEQNLSELIPGQNQKDGAGSVFKRGTHEIIKQLLAAISSIKRKLRAANSIGSSALNLYTQRFALA